MTLSEKLAHKKWTFSEWLLMLFFLKNLPKLLAKQSFRNHASIGRDSKLKKVKKCRNLSNVENYDFFKKNFTKILLFARSDKTFQAN